MTAELFVNLAESTLATGISAVDTTVTLATGTGALFPNPTAGDWFKLVLDDTTHVEITKCTARTGDVCTITRAQESTTARIFAAGTLAENRLTAEALTRLANTSGVNTGDQDISGLVPTTRTVNSKQLNANITLTASDVGADVSGAAAAALVSAESYADGVAASAQNAAQDYAAGLVVGLWDDRGSFDASVNTYPTTGGSGTAGAILKGDIWTISVLATSGPLLGYAVGSTVRAVVDTPAQLGGNWAKAEVGLGYVPENLSNKSTLTSLGTSDTLYPTQNAVKTYADTKQPGSALLSAIASIAATGILLIGAGNTASTLAAGTANQIVGMDAAGTALENKSILGTANQITVTHAAGSITLSLPATIAVNVSGSSASCTGNAATVTTNANLTGEVTSAGNAASITRSIVPTWTAVHTFSNATASTSTTTGAVVITGGLGVAGAGNFGSMVKITGPVAGGYLEVRNSDNSSRRLFAVSTNASAGRFSVFDSTENVSVDILGSGTSSFNSTTTSTSTATGAVVIAGGLGVAGATFIRGGLTLGTSAANPPIAQTLSVQDAGGATPNIAGAPWTFRESRALGTAKGGGFQWFLGATLGSGTTLQTAALAVDLGVTTYKTLTFADAINCALGTTTGTIWGTTTAQKQAFWGATPVVQPSGAAQAALATTAATQTTPWGFTTQAQADSIVTFCNEVQRVLTLEGLWKGAA